MSDLSEANAELEAARAKVPVVRCKGICTDACGPVDGGPLEKLRMRRAGVKLPPRDQAIAELVASDFNYCCPALVDGRCSIYAERPMICRTWAASEDMPCPYGCEVEGRLLTRAETLWLLDIGRKAGLLEQPLPPEHWERIAHAHPLANELLEAARPTATYKTPKGAQPADQQDGDVR